MEEREGKFPSSDSALYLTLEKNFIRAFFLPRGGLGGPRAHSPCAT